MPDENVFPHVVIISVDGLRGDMSARLRKALEARTRGGCATFPNTIGAATTTAVAQGAVFTGRYPLHNGLHASGGRALRVPSVFTHARRNGRRTVLRTDAPELLRPETGFTRDADVVAESDQDFAEAVSRAPSSLSFAHFCPDAGGDRGAYARDMDHFLTGRLPAFVELLTERVAPTGRRLVLVAVGGYGRGGGGSGRRHADSLADDVLRVALVVAGDRIAPREHRHRVRTVDVAPTALELAGIPVPVTGLLDGDSLAGAATGVEALHEDAPALAESYAGHAAYLGDRRMIRALDGTWMENADGTCARRPLPQEALGVELAGMLDDYGATLEEGDHVPVTPEMRAQLRSQGYAV